MLSWFISNDLLMSLQSLGLACGRMPPRTAALCSGCSTEAQEKKGLNDFVGNLLSEDGFVHVSSQQSLDTQSRIGDIGKCCTARGTKIAPSRAFNGNLEEIWNIAPSPYSLVRRQ